MNGVHVRLHSLLSVELDDAHLSEFCKKYFHMQPLTLRYEKNILRSGASVVVGCDEVGRGALAGPVVGAAVTFPKSLARVPLALRQVTDSKQLRPQTRAELVVHIKQHALAWSVCTLSAQMIDRIGIQKANMLVLRRAVCDVVEQLSEADRRRLLVVVDGRLAVPGLEWEQRTMVGGDALVFSVAAASILAKVARDRFMERQHARYPEYEFEKHKGYGSVAHRSRIARYGLCALHRKTFCGRIDEWGL